MIWGNKIMTYPSWVQKNDTSLRQHCVSRMLPRFQFPEPELELFFYLLFLPQLQWIRLTIAYQEFSPKKSKITVIPSNTEKYISFQIEHMYEHMTNWDVFKQTSLLITQNGRNIWRRVRTCSTHVSVKIWNIIMTCSWPWTWRYLQMWWRISDVSVFTSMDSTLLSIGRWPAIRGNVFFFKMIKMKLQLITDPNIFLFFESAVQEGVSTVSNLYAKANNKCLNGFDPSSRTTWSIIMGTVCWANYILPCCKFAFSMNRRKIDFRSAKSTEIGLPDMY